MATLLVKMAEGSYRAFLEVAVKSYADDNVASGRWSSGDALALAQAETERLLPQGHATPDNYLFEIRESLASQPLGYLWAAAFNRGTKKVAFVYQLHVLPQFRRRGHGRAALLEFEVIAQHLGFETIALNVFGSNAAAQALYRSLGFVTTSMSMHKDLQQNGAKTSAVEEHLPSDRGQQGVAMPDATLFQALGGAAGVLRLAHAWHERVMADEVVAHAFSHGFHPQHTERLAAYWVEAWGGPPTYSEQYGSESSVVRMHSGNGPHEQMDRRAIECFDRAMDDVEIVDPVLRQVLHDYFAWATTTMSSYPDDAADVPKDLRIPHWSWDGPSAA